LRTRSLNAVVVAASLCVGAGLLTLVARTARRPDLSEPAAQAIPAGPQLLATLDLRKLRGTPLGALFAGKGREVVQLERGDLLRQICGFDPVEQVLEVAFAVPGSATDGEFGVAASGDLSAPRLAECAARVTAARGGRPVTLREGEFLVVTDVAAAGAGVVAVRNGGLLLMGGGPYVRQMMAAAERRAPSVLSDARHVALRGEVGEREALVISALLTADGRDRVRAELGDPRAPAGSVIGLSLSGTAADPISLHAMIGCDRAEPCAELARSLEGLRKSDEADVGKRLLGLREPLEKATVQALGPTVHVRLALPQATLLRLVEVLFASGNRAPP
jgi:hypothetical protein